MGSDIFFFKSRHVFPILVQDNESYVLRDLGSYIFILIKPSEIENIEENFPTKILSGRKLKEMIETVHH